MAGPTHAVVRCKSSQIPGMGSLHRQHSDVVAVPSGWLGWGERRAAASARPATPLPALPRLCPPCHASARPATPILASLSMNTLCPGPHCTAALCVAPGQDCATITCRVGWVPNCHPAGHCHPQLTSPPCRWRVPPPCIPPQPPSACPPNPPLPPLPPARAHLLRRACSLGRVLPLSASPCTRRGRCPQVSRHTCLYLATKLL
jgi:hypothetical protein